MKYLNRTRCSITAVLLSLASISTPLRADVTQNFQSDTAFVVQDCDGNFIFVETHYHGVIRDSDRRIRSRWSVCRVQYSVFGVP